MLCYTQGVDEPLMLLWIAGVGLAAGSLGGMLGVGGSVLMIPAMTALLGPDQHRYQAAAMAVNVAVAVPAAWRHHRAGAVRGDVLRWMLPAALAMVLVGVAVSNLPAFRGSENGKWLGRGLAVFLVYVAWVNARKLRQAPKPHSAEVDAAERVTPARSGAVGGVMGFIAGLLGIGGGALAVPMQQVVLRVSLKQCIATSAAVMCASAAVGAVYKHATLARHGVEVVDSLTLAACLAPTAFLGGRLGASLTHRLPLRTIRAAFVVLMLAAAWRMATA